MRTNVFDETRAHVAFVHQRVKLADPHLYDGKLAGNKERVESHERANRRQFSD